MRLNIKHIIRVFQFIVFIALILSLYMLVHNFKTNAKQISCWQFPMLLAIFFETLYLNII